MQFLVQWLLIPIIVVVLLPVYLVKCRIQRYSSEFENAALVRSTYSTCICRQGPIERENSNNKINKQINTKKIIIVNKEHSVLFTSI